MDLIDVFQRLGLAIAIGAAVGVERHWRERDEPEGARIAGIRTFTLIGMAGGISGLLDQGMAPSGLSGLIIASFLIVISVVLLRFGLMEARAEGSFSATTVIAGITTFGLGALAVAGDMSVASAAGAATVTILASREFLHADDCGDALVFLLQHYSSDEHVNVGSGEDVTILELTLLVCEVVGFDGRIVHDLSKPDGTPRKLMSADKLRGMGWAPKIRLSEGIRDTYSAFLAGQGVTRTFKGGGV